MNDFITTFGEKPKAPDLDLGELPYDWIMAQKYISKSPSSLTFCFSAASIKVCKNIKLEAVFK